MLGMTAVPAGEKKSENREQSSWADSVLTTLTLDEQIGQLFMVAAYSNRDEKHHQEIDHLIQNQHIGGLIFFQGGPGRQVDLTNRYQAKSKVPLMIGIDAEWGLAMRLDSTFKFPKQMTMGAMRDGQLVYQVGKQIAKHCKRIGVHVNFAPVLDVNNNPNNPIINYRSFGENKEKVAARGILYARGMQENGVLANGKHFPGHGDTDRDSHKALPVVPHHRSRLDSLELYPFKLAFKAGLGSVMVAHLHIPELDDRENKATTLSPKVVTKLLKEELGFQGLIFTDALNMKGVSAFQEPGDVDVEALLAGNDVLLFSLDVPKAIQKIKQAVADKKISKKEIKARCLKILKAKEKYNVNQFKVLSKDHLNEDLNHEKAAVLRRRIYKDAVTLLQNKKDLIPLKSLAQKNILAVAVGEEINNPFTTGLTRYAPVKRVALSRSASGISELKKDLDAHNLVVVSTHDLSQRLHKNYGLSNTVIANLESIAKAKSTILVHFGNPYALAKVDLSLFDAVVVAYEEQTEALDVAAQMVFGGLPIKGVLPVSIGAAFPAGTGIVVEKSIRLEYTSPLDLGILPSALQPVDSIVFDAIQQGVMPGCQLMAIKEGKVFYHKAFGTHTYEGKRKVDLNDVYDIASITKIMGSTASLMKLEDQGKFDVEKNLGDYITTIPDSILSYKKMKLKHMLTHQAGLVSWIPFYVKTLHKQQPSFKFYSKSKTNLHAVRVAENLYIDSTYEDTIFKRIFTTAVHSKKKYKYSDLGYYLLKEVIEKQSGEQMEDFVQAQFYRPLGLDRMTYLPREKYPLSEIVPTEKDDYFRYQLIHGDVHDMGAAMLGGVGGHAGIFSNANSIGVMMQLLLNKGEYGGELFLSDSVIAKYTSSPYLSNGNRRGIGFDKPVREGGAGPTCSQCASGSSFGHSGFTGTLTWADPKIGLVYVFLSNRVYPDADNRKLIKMSVRTNIQQILYNAVNSADESKIGL